MAQNRFLEIYLFSKNVCLKYRFIVMKSCMISVFYENSLADGDILLIMCYYVCLNFVNCKLW